MDKKIKILGIIILFLIVMPFVKAEIVTEINIQNSFKLGETIFFDYTINSDIETNITFIPYILCSNAPQALLELKTISVGVNIPFSQIYNGIKITQEVEPQTCTAQIQILSPEPQIFEKSFSIITNPSFSFDIRLDKKVFLKNEEIKINYDSSVKDLIIQATLTYPNGKKEQITLPSSIKAEQIGTYELKVTASKEGYKTVESKEQFGVIEKEAEIKNKEFNLPKKSISEKILDQDLKFYLIVGSITLIIALILIIFKKIRKSTQQKLPLIHS